MFIPLIIAILMGWVTPETNNATSNNETVFVSNSEPDSSDPTDPTDPTDPGEDDGQDGPGTGGGTGNIPPPKP